MAIADEPPEQASEILTSAIVGDPLACVQYVAPAVLVPLSRGQVAVVDADVAPQVLARRWQWRVISGKVTVYNQELHITGTRDVLLHRFVLSVDDERDVIHLNHSGTDNRRANLRLVGKAEAQKHRQTRGGVPGVWLDRTSETWLAEVVVPGGVARLGPFTTDEEATAAAMQLGRAVDQRRRKGRPGSALKDATADEGPGAPEVERRQSAPARRVAEPRSNTGIKGVTFDPRTQGYIVRAGGSAQRLSTFAAASARASQQFTDRGQVDRKCVAGETVRQLGKFKVICDSVTAEWLWKLGPWGVRRRCNGLLDIRRRPRPADDPDGSYKTAERLIVAADDGETVIFKSGDRLDLRLANLEIVPARSPRR